MNDFPSEWDFMDFRTHFGKRHVGQFSSINQARWNFFQKRSGEKTIREERVNILGQKVFQLWLCTLLLLRQFFQFQYQDAQTFLISTFSICWFGFSTHNFILYEWNFWGILKNNAIRAFPVEFMCVKYSKGVKKKVFLQTKCWWQDRETENKWLRMWGDHTGNDNTIKSLNWKKMEQHFSDTFCNKLCTFHREFFAWESLSLSFITLTWAHQTDSPNTSNGACQK